MITLGVLAAVLLLGLIYEQASRARDRHLPLPGRMIDMDGYRLHLTDDGTGGPTVMILHGAGDCSFSWMYVRRQLAPTARVLSYDRPGMGASPASGQAPDPVRTVEELHKVLERSGAPGPYVLVGHSLGGLIARLYAHRYPDEVAGIVFVDSSHEALLQDKPFLASLKALAVMAKIMRALSVVGVPRLLASLGVMPMYAAERKYYVQQLSPTEYRQWQAACLGNFSPAAAAELLSAVPLMEAAARAMSPTQFGDMPVAVLNNPSFGPAWSEKGRELASRSTNATHKTSDRPGHSLQMPRPELVLEAVGHVLDQVRERGARVLR
jgi:pimeloyl-ACP methyl ester carboxylesterase